MEGSFEQKPMNPYNAYLYKISDNVWEELAIL
jgi:hypothetical protein